MLNNLSIPRYIFVTKNNPVTLVGLAVAISASYVAVIYFRTMDQCGQILVSLLISQFRVSPMSKITLPSLEHCAADISAKLMAHIIQVYSARHSIAFTDCMITLSWIKSPHERITSFVSENAEYITFHLLVPHYWKRKHW